MTLTPNPYWRIEREYGSLDYKGKVVLDIGADYGCTPEFFLSRGAKQVIAVEANPEYYNRLVGWANAHAQISVKTVQGLTERNVHSLMTEYRPQIVKIDCEGCECEFLRLNDAELLIPDAYIMETHSVALFNAFMQLFARLKYRTTVIEEFLRNPPERHRKVFKAERRVVTRRGPRKTPRKTPRR